MFNFMASVKQTNKGLYFIFTKMTLTISFFHFFKIYILSRQCYANISNYIKYNITREIEYSIDDVFYWTDSMSVLRYIMNTKTRFHTFVANRLAVIHESSDISQWNYIETKQNPADLASRGASIEKFSIW
jgi:hypothetical protein